MRTGSTVQPRYLWSAIIAGLMIASLTSIMTNAGLWIYPGYRAVVVEQGDVTSTVLTTGRVQPDNRIDVKAPLPGRSEEVLVKIGEWVEKGQPLLRVSSTDRASIMDAVRVANPNEIQYWEKRLRPTEILSPSSGLVIQRNIEPGQTYTEKDALLVIADRMVVEAPVDQTDVALIRAGQRATIVLDAYPDTVMASRIVSLSFENRMENGIATYVARAAFDLTPDFVRIGMTANVKFDVAVKHDAALLPIEALRSADSKLYVLIPGAVGGDPQRRFVHTGISDGRRIEVDQGLEPGDVVLIPTRLLADEFSSESDSGDEESFLGPAATESAE